MAFEERTLFSWMFGIPYSVGGLDLLDKWGPLLSRALSSEIGVNQDSKMTMIALTL